MMDEEYSPTLMLGDIEQMNVWFSKNLGDAMLVAESLGRIYELFVVSYKNSDSSKEKAVFIRHESEGRLHCEVNAYFTPETYTLARAVGAARCEKPRSNGLSLLIGSEESWSVHFPDFSD